MCGIAGIVHPEPSSLGLEMLGRMSEMLSHRGPDARGTFADDHAGLAHTRLSIIDLQGGGQPMGNEDGSLQIVFNGEIFNYLELREDLIKRGHHFATRSDTEVILHSFEEFGEDCVQQMNGQWAFAIWDRMKRSLFLSRDRMGVRPLFYAFAGRTFLFGSEIKALLVHPGVKRTLDLRALDEIFTFWHCLPPNTAFEGVRELPPGHSATLAKGRLTIRKYWELQFPESSDDGQGASEEERSAELLELLRDATRIRLRADVPVGAYLSGGLDSTVVTALARQFVPHRLRTFSIRFDDAEFDEGAYQQAAIRHLQTDHQEIYCDGATIGRVFPDVIWHAEKPILRTAPAPLFLLSKLVHESGFKVVLTGEGSDEVLGGYDIFKEYKIRHFWAAHQDSRLRPLLLRRLYPYLKNIGAQPEAYLNAFFHPDAAEQEDPFSSHQPRWRLTSGLKLFYSADVKAELNGRQPADDLGLRLPPAFLKWNGFHRAQYLEASYLMPGYILSSQGDRVAMAHAVEGRFPFLDCRVVEFAAALPPRLKMKVLQEKYLLKRCARGLVPDAVIRRHKQPYRAPDARSFFPGGRPLDYIDALLSADRIRQDGVFEPAAVQRLVEKARRGNLAGLRDNMAMVGIVSTQLLLHRFGRDFHVEEQHNGERS